MFQQPIMNNLKKIFSTRLLRSSSSIAIGTALFGFATNMHTVKAEAPPLCKDVLTQTTAKQNIFSENTTAVATKLSAYNYYCLGSPDRFDIAIYEMQEALKRGERVELRDLFTIEPRIQKARISRNPKTNEKVKVDSF